MGMDDKPPREGENISHQMGKPRKSLSLKSACKGGYLSFYGVYILCWGWEGNKVSWSFTIPNPSQNQPKNLQNNLEDPWIWTAKFLTLNDEENQMIPLHQLLMLESTCKCQWACWPYINWFAGIGPRSLGFWLSPKWGWALQLGLKWMARMFLLTFCSFCVASLKFEHQSEVPNTIKHVFSTSGGIYHNSLKIKWASRGKKPKAWSCSSCSSN